MKLVACTSCRAQYDVTTLEPGTFRCRCGEEVQNRDLRAVDAEIHRCGSCGAIVAADAQSCEYCSSAIVHDPRRLSFICPECFARNPDECRYCTACGVAFEPQAVPGEDTPELPCPVCGVLMPPRSFDGLDVNECPHCNGLWAPDDRLERLVQRAIDRRKQHAEEGVFVQPRVSGAAPTLDVVYRKCPVCEALMHRANFRKRSGVIVDECRAHGTWLDADELEQIAGFILTGGLAEVQAHADAEQRAELRRQAAAARASYGTLAASCHASNHASRNDGLSIDGGAILRTVVELFQSVLS